MHFKVDGAQHNRIYYIDVVQGEVSINFSMKNYARTTFFNSSTFFDNINAYLQSLPPDVRAKLFSKYVAIKEAYDEINDPARLHMVVQKLVTEIYSIVTFDNLKSWYLKHGRVTIPPDLKDSFEGEDNDLTEKLTYVKSDYYDLTILSSLLKFMAPVFGEYLDSMSDEVGVRFKEHRAFSLLVKSQIFGLEAFKRLNVYIDASLEKEKRKPSDFKSSSAVFGGLGSSELPDWLLSKAVVRRLAIHEEKSENSIIANIYHSIDQQIKSLDKTFGGSIKDKQNYDTGKGEEDKASVVENYKVKQTISDGDLSVLSIYTNQLHDMIKIVDPLIPTELVVKCDDNLSRRNYFNISEHQITLAQWVLHKSISPRGIPSLKKTAILKAIAGAQSVLWGWGFKELALLMTCEPYVGGGMTGSPSSRLGKKYIDVFEDLYPHRQVLSKNVNVRNSNPAMIAIEKLAGNLSQSDWISYSPGELEEEMGLDPKNKVHIVSAEIKHQLADLIIRLNQRNLEDKI